MSLARVRQRASRGGGGKWLISDGEPAGMFEEALRGMARDA